MRNRPQAVCEMKNTAREIGRVSVETLPFDRATLLQQPIATPCCNTNATATSVCTRTLPFGELHYCTTLQQHITASCNETHYCNRLRQHTVPQKTITATHCFVVSCSELHWVAVSCSKLQWVPADCSELQWVAVRVSHANAFCPRLFCSELQWVAVSCIDLQSILLSCIELQWVAVDCSELQ